MVDLEPLSFLPIYKVRSCQVQSGHYSIYLLVRLFHVMDQDVNAFLLIFRALQKFYFFMLLCSCYNSFLLNRIAWQHGNVHMKLILNAKVLLYGIYISNKQNCSFTVNESTQLLFRHKQIAICKRTLPHTPRGIYKCSI